MKIALAPHLRLDIKHTSRSPSGTWSWQRRIPTDLAPRYGRSGNIKQRIGGANTDPRIIADKVARLDREHEAKWAAMRANPDMSPEPIREAAAKLLTAHGFTTEGKPTHPEAASLASDKLDAARIAYAERQEDPEAAYYGAALSDFLSPVQEAAVKIAAGADMFLLSDALEVYLAEHPKGSDPAWAGKLRITWDRFIRFSGERVFAEFTRDGAKAYRDHMLAKGNRTGTVRRRINDLRAIFERAIVERRKQFPAGFANVWERVIIQGLGKDAKKRQSLDAGEDKKLREDCRAADDPLRWMLALQLDLGTRIGEPAGLLLSDFQLDHETPHVILQPHPWRSLKTTESARTVPLVGDALWAAQRVSASAVKGQRFAFPRYCEEAGVKSNTASAAANKWMKDHGIPRTSHELRHSLRSRMNAASVPQEVQQAIGGWAGKGEMSGYGGHALKTMAYWLRRTLPGAVEETPPALPMAPL